MKITPKNWASFQHYKDRSPSWIKLHRSLLDDFDFQRLPVASRALAPMLWLLASEDLNGEIDADLEKLSFRLRQSKEELRAALKPLILSGFFDVGQDDSEALALLYQDACPEKETQVQTETQVKGSAEEKSSAGADAPSVVEFPKAEKLNPANDGHPSWWPRRDRYGYLPAGIDEKITFDVGVAILGQKSRGLIAKLVKLYEYDYRGVTDILLQSESKNEPTEWIGGVLRKLPHERPMARHVQYPEDAYRGAL